MSEFFPTGQHPDADQLSAFVEHTLPAYEQQQTFVHLADCPACRQIVALCLPPVEGFAVERPDRLRVGWLTGWRIAWAGVPLLLTALLVSVFVHERNPASHESVHSPQSSVRPETVARGAEPQMPSLPLKQRVRPANPTASPRVGALASRAPQRVVGGVMGGMLGGIGVAPPRMPAPIDSAASTKPLAAFMAGRARFAPLVPAPLPSGLAAISVAARGTQRLAIDTNHAVFFSEDEGRKWKAVSSQWEGRAMQVALITTAPAGEKVQAMRMKDAQAGAMRTVLSGTITDQSGVVVPGATVTAFDSGNEGYQVTVTDSQGRYQLGALAEGKYRIEVDAPGFMKESQAEKVSPGQAAVVNFTLRPGAVSQSVTVEAAPQAVDLLTSDASAVLPPFELTSDDGSRWTSPDGQSWSRK